MIETTHSNIKKTNTIFKTIRNFELIFPDEFSKTGIVRCGHCNATGISDKSQMSHCVNCGSIGYVGFEKLSGEFICRNCRSYGCSICNNKGIVDWVTHAHGRDTRK